MASDPLPAQYDGIRFRSRTEARWARFWKALGIAYDYEAQGYKTDGECYSPDFMVFPASGLIWVEIKGSWESDPEGVQRFRNWADQRPKQPSKAALIEGMPGPNSRIIAFGGDIDAADPLNGPWEDEGHIWRPCPSGHHFDLAYGSVYIQDGCPGGGESFGEAKLIAAVAAARNARFGIHEDPSGSAE